MRDTLSPAISAATLSEVETSFISESITMQNKDEEENKDDQFWTQASTPPNHNFQS